MRIAAIGSGAASETQVGRLCLALLVCSGVFAALADHADGRCVRRGAAVWAQDAVGFVGEGAESSDRLACQSAYVCDAVLFSPVPAQHVCV